MKKLYTLLVTAFVSTQIIDAQNMLLNGSFETNSAVANTTDLQASWPTTVSNSWEVDGGSMDLIMTDNCGGPSNGNWFVRTSPAGGTWPYLAFSLKINTTLTLGSQYTLTFDKRYCGPNSSPIDVGVSTDSTLMGTIFHTFTAPLVNSWAGEYLVFQAPVAANYLTVNVGVTGGTGQISLDNFVLQAGAVGIKEISESAFSVYPNPATDKLNIHLKNISSLTEINLTDLTGRIIKTFNVCGEINSQLDVSDVVPGIYFLNIKGEKNETVKIVKQ